MGNRHCWHIRTRRDDTHEPGAAIEGLSSDDRRDPLSPAGSPRASANLCLAGPGHRAAISGAAQVPGFLATASWMGRSIRSASHRPGWSGRRRCGCRLRIYDCISQRRLGAPVRMPRIQQYSTPTMQGAQQASAADTTVTRCRPRSGGGFRRASPCGDHENDRRGDRRHHRGRQYRELHRRNDGLVVEGERADEQAHRESHPGQNCHSV